MLDLIEDTVAELTDIPVTVIIDNELPWLGETTSTPNSFTIAVNVVMHTLYGEEALEQLLDTIRHEVAHVLHQSALKPLVIKRAKSIEMAYNEGAAKFGLSKFSFDYHYQAEMSHTLRYENSHHGAAWKRSCSVTGAVPKAIAPAPRG